MSAFTVPFVTAQFGITAALKYVILVPILFLVGAIPMAQLIARRRGVGDLRQIGSQNVGASNITRLAGKKWGALTLFLDAAKAFIPIALLHGFGVIREIDILWAGAAVMLGHNYTPFLGWRGGKGVSVIGGVLFYLCWWAVLISLIPAFLAYRWLRWVPGLTIALLLAFEACALLWHLSLTVKLAPLVFAAVSFVAALPDIIHTPGKIAPPALRSDGSTY